MERAMAGSQGWEEAVDIALMSWATSGAAGRSSPRLKKGSVDLRSPSNGRRTSTSVASGCATGEGRSAAQAGY